MPASEQRDLMQKLIDAGREHEYPLANERQNVFAQRYYRLGLFTEARNRHDALLSDVVQRFQLHVFLNRICKQATDDEVAEAIQHSVIDPICAKYKEDAVSADTVLSAIYFLTERCHLRWDAT